MDIVWQDLTSMAITYGGKTLIALIVLLVGWIFAGWLGSLAGKSLSRAKVDVTLARFLKKFVRWGVLLLVVLACLSIFGIETTSFAALIGSVGIAIGLAFQGTLSNFAAGVMLLMFRPYHVGDVVTVAGKTGKVHEIELFTTSLDTFDNRRVIVPNGQIFGNTIENITYHPHRRADVAVGVAYAADIDRTREVLTKAIGDVPGILPDPEPSVVLDSLGDSAVQWSVRVWAPKDDFLTVHQATVRAVKLALDDAGIEIPFPQLDVNVSPPQP